MTTVYVVTAGKEDTYRIERIYLDSEQAYGFAQAYNGVGPTDPVQVEEWQVGDPTAQYDGPYWRAEWWARVPISKSVAGRCGTPTKVSDLMTSPSARNGGPATPFRMPR